MPFSHRRRVEFRDTDAAGIAHFSVFFPMMEEAEHAALRHLGLRVLQPTGNGEHLTWPRVAAQCDYLAPARFEETLRIDVSVLKLGTSSVTYGFAFFRESDLAALDAGTTSGAAQGDALSGAAEPIARGSVTAVCCLLTVGQPLRKQPIPDDLRELLGRLA
ncbi:MAG: acyl-CoA thioesterase [Planctomycetaceae bacterium]|nr:MAG: acyl-CoA thioesterase [Planctomycetaceae bacterium]